jgi:hypothetical protein
MWIYSRTTAAILATTVGVILLGACFLGTAKSWGVDVPGEIDARIAEANAQRQQAQAEKAIAENKDEEIRAEGQAYVDGVTAQTDAYVRRAAVDTQSYAALFYYKQQERRETYWMMLTGIVVMAGVFALLALVFALYPRIVEAFVVRAGGAK